MGLGARPPGKFLKICILLWLRMPLPAEFEYFLETKPCHQPLKNDSFLACQESQRPLLDRSARPPPHKFYYIFVRISRTNFLKSGAGVQTTISKKAEVGLQFYFYNYYNHTLLPVTENARSVLTLTQNG